MASESLIVAWGDLMHAEAAMRRLADGGFPAHRIALVARDAPRESLRRRHSLSMRGRGLAAGGGVVGGVAGLAMASRLDQVSGREWLMVAGVLVAALLGTLLGRALIAGRTAAHRRELPQGDYLVVARGNARELARAHTILAEWKVQERRECSISGARSEETTARAGDNTRPPLDALPTRRPVAPDLGLARDRANDAAWEGEHAGFSRREWQRLVFLRWLYRQGRLHDWVE